MGSEVNGPYSPHVPDACDHALDSYAETAP
jgi:hypothetical protein